MAGWYRVQQGDCLSSLAGQARLASWKKIYDDPHNSDFRRLRPDPNVIQPGDTVYIPALDVVEQPAATEIRHKYLLKKDPTKLRIVLADDDREPYSHCKYSLKINDKVTEGTTDGAGLIEQQIDPAAQEAELIVWWDDAQTLHCRWKLQLGHLDPVEQLTGVQARLNNLGFNAGPVDGVNGPITKQSVKRFQNKYGLSVDGIPGPDTQKKLKDVHGC